MIILSKQSAIKKQQLCFPSGVYQRLSGKGCFTNDSVTLNHQEEQTNQKNTAMQLKGM